MTITLKMNPTDKVIELGGGSNPLVRPNVDVRQCYDDQGNPTVDFTANFEEPLPIQDEEWDAVFSKFVIEHISWRKVRGFLREVFRILKWGGKVVFVTANTPAQIEWIKTHPEGWDGKPAFKSFSCVLFGDQDYPDNAHKNFMSPELITGLLTEVGFVRVGVRAYGVAQTDMVVEANKPLKAPGGFEPLCENTKKEQLIEAMTFTPEKQEVCTPISSLTREQMFDRYYFNGGGKVGGYAHQGYWDFPCHEITVRHILARRPSSVLEIGAARGYILKRIQDRGIRARGIEISKHCRLTRVCQGVCLWDVCKTPWMPGDMEFDLSQMFDLCYSIATLEHIPEEFLPKVISEMARNCKRGLHGIDFGEKDDGFDKTHCSLHSKNWWIDKFAEYAPGWPIEIVNKEELESGPFPEEVLRGDGKVKLNVGSYTTMFHYGWVNIDQHDLGMHAASLGYNFQHMDVRGGLPYATGSVDMIFSSHFLEHLTYDEGLKFLRECRRVLKPDSGVIRIIVPDASLLHSYYHGNSVISLDDFDEINEGCAKSPTKIGKLWALLHEGHKSAYDWETMAHLLREAAFVPAAPDATNRFRHCINNQLLSETIEMFPEISLYMDAVCLI